MYYDLSKDLDRQSFKTKVKFLYSKKVLVELVDKSRRTSQQNRYLHLILGWFAKEYGVSLDYVKTNYFKRHVNRDIFVMMEYDKLTGREEEIIRSSAKLNKEEMITAIERFRNWSSAEAGIYLPSADEEDYLRAIDYELNRNKNYQ